MADRRVRVTQTGDDRFTGRLAYLTRSAHTLDRLMAQQVHPLDRPDPALRGKGEPQLWTGDQA